EFRVFWNKAPDVPALTLSDTALDVSPSWSGANLLHDIGQLDGLNAWCADPARNHTGGLLSHGTNTREISAGQHIVAFELKVDNFGLDNMTVATVSVVDNNTGKILAMKDVARSDFRSILYQTITLEFRAETGTKYDFRTFWHYAPRAPRLTQRSVFVK